VPLSHVERDINAVMPSREAAYLFAREVPCKDIGGTSAAAFSGHINSENGIPLAIHAAWNYWDQDQTTKFFQWAVAHQ
jgi:hypothetical protein